VFIDLGANRGNSYEDLHTGWAKTRLPHPITELETYLFEPNPRFAKYIMPMIDKVTDTAAQLSHRPVAPIHYYPVAAATRTGVATLFIDPSTPIGGWRDGDGYGNGGSSLLADMPAVDPSNAEHNPNIRHGLVRRDAKQEALRVLAVDFSWWLQAMGFAAEARRGELELYLKVDVEGFEIELFEKMLRDGTMCAPRVVFVEWHDGMMANAKSGRTREMARRKQAIIDQTERVCRRRVHFSAWY